MAYVAYYWKKFAGSNKTQKSSRKIARVAKNERDNKKQAQDYEGRAKKLLDWIKDNDKNMSNKDPKSFGNSLKEVQDKNNDFKKFKNKEKPEKAKEKADIQLQLINLQSKQKQEGVPVYQPPKEISPESINNNWGKLDSTQKTYEQQLREQIAKMKYLEMILDRYRARSKKVLGWQGEKDQFLKEPLNKEKQIPAIRGDINMLNAFGDEMKAINTTLDSTLDLGQEIIDAEHAAADEVMDTNVEMKKNRANLTGLKDKRQDDLEKLLKYKLEIEQLCVDFAKKGDQLNLFLEECLLGVAEPVRASSVKDVDNAEKLLNNLINSHKSSKNLLDELNDIFKKVKSEGENPLQFSRFTIPGITEKYNQVKKDMDEKKRISK